MKFEWHHLIVYALFFILGAYVVSKFPQVNLIGTVLGSSS